MRTPPALLRNKAANICYAAGLAIGAISALLMAFIGFHPLIHNILVFLSTSLICLGFLIWNNEEIKGFRNSPLSKVGLTLFHALAVILSIIPARLAVANSLQLPPQDFDVSVAIVALAFYMPVCAALAGSLIALLFVTSTVCWSVYFAATRLLRFFLKVFHALKASAAFSDDPIHKTLYKYDLYFAKSIFGLISISFITMSFWQWSLNSVLTYGASAIRFIAYTSDFHSADAYPGVQKGKRWRLHENGVVSYAERKGWTIELRVDKVSEQQDCTAPKLPGGQV